MKEVRKPDAVLAKLLPKVPLQPDVTYIPSQFALPFEHRGKRYIFNNLTKQCIEGELPASARAGEGYDDLIAALCLVPEGKDECAYYNAISALVRAYSRKKAIRGYTILPTTACNARCVYCFEEGMKPVTMTPEVVEQTIRFIADASKGNDVSLNWFGGEPLMRPEIIDRICEGLREAGVAYSSGMITNGSLVTPGIVEKMAGAWKMRSLQVSMDGAEEDYIARKNYPAYHDNYHRVIRAVRLMAEAGLRVTIRCNVDEDNWERIPAFLQDLSAAIPQKEKVRVYVSPLYQIRAGEEDLALWEKIRDGVKLIGSAGFRAGAAMSVEGVFRVAHCMADGGGVTIDADGSLYPCDHCMADTRMGDVFHGITDEAARQAFCRVDVTREKCRKCPFLPDCTSFSACPVTDYHCREARELMAVASLEQMMDRKENEETDEDKPVC
ncbi:MAG: radical SAM protein [Clostridia bacterium]|nr:radical SAM protein [Clostridia bacterium]